MQTTNDELSQSFQLLCELVRESQSLGRICLGAPLKLELQRRTRRNFNQQNLGFPRFGDFLRAAEAAGLIQLLRTPGGDLEVRLSPGNHGVSPSVAHGFVRESPELTINFPPVVIGAPRPAITPPAVGARPAQGFYGSDEQQVRVRQDLWDAFNSIFGTWAYDRKNDAAYKVPPNLFGPTANNPDLVEIPSGRERTLEWMRSFAEMQENETKERLLIVLNSDSAPFNFRKLIGVDSKLRRSWRRYHIKQVLAAIDAWATSNGLHPQRVTTPFWPTSVQPRPWSRAPERRENPSKILASSPERRPISVPAPVQQSSIPGGLNSRLESLVDQLIDELLRLRGALQIINQK